ncbi:MAG: family, N-terminal domain, partial [Rhodospirillaceae bacterium]|nr:family, N-terminal domain [Rhodospirillaceae bacterium]
MLDGEARFVGVDVATRLGYAKPRNAITQHCKGALKWGYLMT